MKIKDFVFVLLIVIIIGCIGYLIYWTQTEGGKCVMNPLIYGADKVRDVSKTDTSVECSCYAPLTMGMLRFNSSSMWIESYLPA